MAQQHRGPGWDNTSDTAASRGRHMSFNVARNVHMNFNVARCLHMNLNEPGICTWNLMLPGICMWNLMLPVIWTWNLMLPGVNFNVVRHLHTTLKIWRMYLWWSLCTLYLHACQVRVTVGLRSLYTVLVYFECQLLSCVLICTWNLMLVTRCWHTNFNVAKCLHMKFNVAKNSALLGICTWNLMLLGIGTWNLMLLFHLMKTKLIIFSLIFSPSGISGLSL